jgi:hypothetical protein
MVAAAVATATPACVDFGRTLLGGISREDIERAKCALDPWYCISRYVHTIDDNGDELLFPNYPYLKKYIYAIHNKRKVLCFKTRQMLISWASVAYAYHLATFKSNQTILFISKKKPDANELVKRVHDIHRNFPDFLKMPFKRGPKSRVKIEFANSSRIFSMPCVDDAARGYTVNLGFLDEIAFYKNAKGVYQGCRPSLGKGGRLVMVSTPNGDARGKFFREMVKDHVKYGFHRMDVDFTMNPRKDEQWLKEERQNLTEMQWKYEHGLYLGVAGAGAVFKKYDSDIHVIEAFEIPSNWKKYRTIDFGPNLACIWVAEDPHGRYYVYRELYIKGRTVEDRARMIIAHSHDENYELTIGDEADPQAMTDFASHGIYCIPSGTKDTIDSIAILEKLFEDVGQFQIFDTCKKTAESFEDYMGDENGVPVKHQFDHGIDAIRYLIRKLKKMKVSHAREMVEQTDKGSLLPNDMVISSELGIDVGRGFNEKTFGFGEGHGDLSKEVGL